MSGIFILLQITFSDLSTLTVSPCVTRFHYLASYLSHGLTAGSSFLTVLKSLSGFSLKLTIS